MSEFYVNSYSPITINVYDANGSLADPDGPIAVSVFDYDRFDEDTGDLGVLIQEDFASQIEYNSDFQTGRFYYILTPSLTANPRRLMLRWEYEIDGVERKGSQIVFINVPYARLDELRTIKELNDYSDEELIVMERMVAKIIDVYCGQSFGFEYNATKTAMGGNSDYLWLPERLWRLEDVTILDDYVSVLRNPEGDIIGKDTSSRSIGEYVVLDPDNPWRIRNRRNIDYVTISVTSNNKIFKSGNIYAVTGNWGYPYVPIEVSEATKILVKTYVYDAATYRERYITSLRAGNWRMEFAATGDQTTGNANADILLSAYRNINAAVI